MLFFLLAVACAEEMAVRGFMWNRLAEVLPNRWAVLGVDSALFLFLHATSWVKVDGDPITISAQAVIGLALGFIRMASRGLVTPVTVHFLVDVFGV